MNLQTDRVELLAPAGDMEKLKTAIQYGADAVYVGLPGYSLRALCRNFDFEDLSQAVRYAHENQVRIFTALNILARPDDMSDMRQLIRQLGSAGIDALIVADPGIFSLVREELPQMKIHISTQASVTNARSCRFWHNLGATRIILARELSLEDIRKICADIPPELELEGFVHGAMCMAWSGRCLLSNYLTGRDSNRGHCAQPCRWSWETQVADSFEEQSDQESEADGTALILRENKQGSYIFNSSDICMIEHLPELLAAGLNSLKIEGRTKSAFYVATVVKAYRQALDSLISNPDEYRFDPAWLEDLKKTVHRPFATGFYFTRPEENARINMDGNMERTAEVAGIIRAWLPTVNVALVEQKNRIESGDKLELVEPSGRHRPVIARPLYDLEWNLLENTPHAQMMYYLPLDAKTVPGAYLRRLKKQTISSRQ